jgi:hypothetical protein
MVPEEGRKRTELLGEEGRVGQEGLLLGARRLGYRRPLCRCGVPQTRSRRDAHAASHQ